MRNLLDSFLAHLVETEGAEMTVSMRGTIEDCDGYSEGFAHIATIYNSSGMTYSEIKLAFRDYLEDVGAYSSCGHSHDCCGCAFLQSAGIINEYPNDEKGVFLIYKEKYSINI